MRIRAHIASAVLLPCAALALALATVAGRAHALDVPALRGRVNDYAKLLPSDRAAALEQRLAGYEQRTGQQFVVLTVPSLEAEASH